MEGKLDAALEKMEGHDERLNKHGERIGKLERWQSWTLGAGAAVGVAVAAVWQLVSTFTHGK